MAERTVAYKIDASILDSYFPCVRKIIRKSNRKCFAIGFGAGCFSVVLFIVAIWIVMAFAAVASAAEPHSPAVHDRVDLIEVNHFYNKQGQHVIDQVIFYDWDKPTARFQVRAWRLIKDNNCLPTRKNGVYVSYWRDTNVLRKVVAPRKRETWTNYDPEVMEREVLPIEFRRELVKCVD